MQGKLDAGPNAAAHRARREEEQARRRGGRVQAELAGEIEVAVPEVDEAPRKPDLPAPPEPVVAPVAAPVAPAVTAKPVAAAVPHEREREWTLGVPQEPVASGRARVRPCASRAVQRADVRP